MENNLFMALSENNCMSTQSFSTELIEEAKNYIRAYLETHFKELRSESSIFGTLTLKVKPRYVPVVAGWLADEGIELKEIRYEIPRRRNSNVEMVVFINQNAIIFDQSYLRKPCE